MREHFIREIEKFVVAAKSVRDDHAVALLEQMRRLALSLPISLHTLDTGRPTVVDNVPSMNMVLTKRETFVPRGPITPKDKNNG